MVKTGYLIPVDASGSQDKVATWINLEGWLHAVSLLPAKHILVILDACHSGIALDPIIKWRDVGAWQGTPLSTLKARRSGRIITSALDDQVALDSGPVHGHSLFTGCLMEGLTDGIRRGGNRVTTGSELGLYVRRRVQTYPNSRQTPDFGTFAFDDRGEMVIPLAIEPAVERPEPVAADSSSSAWLELIDLDDPEPASEAPSPFDHTASGTAAEAHGGPVATAEPNSMRPLAPADAPEPALDAEVRAGGADPGTEAHDVGAKRPGPDPLLSRLPNASAPSSPSPPRAVPPPNPVASVALTPEPASAATGATPTLLPTVDPAPNPPL